jgi:hypothetical protein
MRLYKQFNIKQKTSIDISTSYSVTPTWDILTNIFLQIFIIGFCMFYACLLCTFIYFIYFEYFKRSKENYKYKSAGLENN